MAFIELAPGVRARVCATRVRGPHGGRRPRIDCERKARRARKLCPGCGAKGFEPGRLCGSCKNTLALARAGGGA